MMRSLFWATPVFFLQSTISGVYAQKTYERLTKVEKELYDEHVVGGQPDGSSQVLVRHGYVVRYNSAYRIPEWAAYHVKPDYLKTPKRERRFKTFRTDPDIENPVVTGDYTGSGYARGHMAPHFAMGGDRNKNGRYSHALVDDEDRYDDETVLQANYMTNIAPQHQDALNGPGGPWYALETVIRKELVGRKRMELNVFAGSIVRDPDNYYVMINRNGETAIVGPDEFYQVIVYLDRAENRFHRLRMLQFNDNHKRVYRIYTEMKLNLRRKHKKRLPSRVLNPLVQPLHPNLTWSMDFMHGGLF